ncbi:MAG: indole-3-glycerol phosphate synthase TrpC [Verrucomicrobiota bacterium]
MDKLTEIMNWKRQEIAPLIRDIADHELEAYADQKDLRGDFRAALQRDSGVAVISEIKRKSPSAGQIKELGSSLDQAAKYIPADTDCLSILTDEKYFGGTITDLEQVTCAYNARGQGVPCLRKDFMVHPAQVLQAVLAGASAILIIVRALSDDEMKALRYAADLAGLDSLYEIHSETELETAVKHDAKIIGVNNRDLAVFKTDLAFSEQLIPQFPQDVIAISESGIWSKEDAQRAKDAGAHAILVGEALMKAEDTAALIKDFHSVT